MNPKRHRPIWRRKRVLLPLIFVVGVIGALAVAVSRSDNSRIIIYNETGDVVRSLKVNACGQGGGVGLLADEESFRWKLAKSGNPGEITLEADSVPPWRWRGGYIEPAGGVCVILRLLPSGEVEFQSEVSIWQQWLR